MTDEEGRFFFSDLPTDEVTLRVQLGGYTSLVERVIPTPPEVGVFRVRIAPIWASLSELLVIAGPSPAPASADVIIGSNNDSKTALELLAEKIPGVRATLSQSAVRSGARIRLRGNNSISFSSAPAIYVDGIRVNSETTGLQALELIPAEEVAGIRILKGPSATGQYGDGAAGVILIETRTGRR